jgi:hypothetical protein
LNVETLFVCKSFTFVYGIVIIILQAGGFTSFVSQITVKADRFIQHCLSLILFRLIRVPKHTDTIQGAGH